MTLQISTDNSIIIDHKNTGLKLAQTQSGTVIYRPENRLNGQKYEVVAMPHNRYSAAHGAPSSGVAGCAQLEVDVFHHLMKINAKPRVIPNTNLKINLDNYYIAQQYRTGRFRR